MSDIDCTQYLATSAKTGEILTRDGRVVVATKAEWGPPNGHLWSSLIPCPKRPFGAVDLVSRGREEVDVDGIAAIIKAYKGYTDYRVAEAIHARIYGPTPPMAEPETP